MTHAMPFTALTEDLDTLILDVISEVEARLGYASEEPAQAGPSSGSPSTMDRLAAEIISVGRKLWERQYVDGCGGNISIRIAPDRVLCTPTMISKADLTPDSLCITDLDGHLVEGTRRRTSELLLHLEIYKATPHARAVVHCHPPHATAYAITGTEPPPSFLVEQELFVGPVPIAPYETPGTAAFAETILPYVRDHNSILLANHGIVCWADTATHAEWLVEIVDAYCRTLLLAAQVGTPMTPISRQKLLELSMKQKAAFASLQFHPTDDRNEPVGDGPVDRGLRTVNREELDRIVRTTLTALLGKGSFERS